MRSYSPLLIKQGVITLENLFSKAMSSSISLSIFKSPQGRPARKSSRWLRKSSTATPTHGGSGSCSPQAGHRVCGCSISLGVPSFSANDWPLHCPSVLLRSKDTGVRRKAGCEVNPRLKRGGSGDQRARDRVVGIRGGGLHPAYPGRQLQNRRPERPAAEPAAGRVVRIVGNRGAALQQPQTIIENRALTCVENVVRLELVIVSCSVMVRQSVCPLESAVRGSQIYWDR